MSVSRFRRRVHPRVRRSGARSPRRGRRSADSRPRSRRRQATRMRLARPRAGAWVTGGRWRGVDPVDLAGVMIAGLASNTIRRALRVARPSCRLISGRHEQETVPWPSGGRTFGGEEAVKRVGGRAAGQRVDARKRHVTTRLADRVSPRSHDEIAFGAQVHIGRDHVAEGATGPARRSPTTTGPKPTLAGPRGREPIR